MREGIKFILVGGRENEAVLKDIRMEISGDSYYWYKVDENLARWKYFTIHHSVTNSNYTPEQIAQIHLNKGWGGIGYHFVITNDGIIHYVGDLGTWRANVANRNHECIGILLVGDFRDGRCPTDAQYKATNVLWREFLDDKRFSGVKNINALKFHNELQATACPCDVDKTTIANGLPVYETPKPVTIKPVDIKPLPLPEDKTIGAGTPTPVIEEKELQEYEKPSQEMLDSQQKVLSIWELIKEFIDSIIKLIFK